MLTETINPLYTANQMSKTSFILEFVNTKEHIDLILDKGHELIRDQALLEVRLGNLDFSEKRSELKPLSTFYLFNAFISNSSEKQILEAVENLIKLIESDFSHFNNMFRLYYDHFLFSDNKGALEVHTLDLYFELYESFRKSFNPDIAPLTEHGLTYDPTEIDNSEYEDFKAFFLRDLPN